MDDTKLQIASDEDYALAVARLFTVEADYQKRARLQLAVLAAITRGRRSTREPRFAAAVLDEMDDATRKFPTWPNDVLHAVAVLGEEYGELVKACLQSVYEPHKLAPGNLREEALQTAAMALRFVESLPAYTFHACNQHTQRGPT